MHDDKPAVRLLGPPAPCTSHLLEISDACQAELHGVARET